MVDVGAEPIVTESCERLNNVLSNIELPCRYFEDSEKVKISRNWYNQNQSHALKTKTNRTTTKVPPWYIDSNINYLGGLNWFYTALPC